MATKKNKTTKTLLGVGAAAAAGAAAYFLLIKDSDAAGPKLPPGDDKPDDPEDPTPKGPTGGGGGGAGGGGGGSGGGAKISRPSGDPPPGGCSNGTYDKFFWDLNTPEDSRQQIVDTLEDLGYAFNGATKSDGTFKTSGTVKRFQEDYNLLSATGDLLPNMGGLSMDGKIGPCTLTALKYALFNMEVAGNFRTIANNVRVAKGLPV